MSYAQTLIEQLNLLPHPEGGYYKRSYASAKTVTIDSKTRFCTTIIYYLLANENKSTFHRLKSDEIWIYQLGCGFKLHLIYPNGQYDCLQLAGNIEKNQKLQIIIEAGVWFAAELIDSASYALASCIVSPGFNFDDFEIGDYKMLITLFPQHIELIKQFKV